MKYFYILSSLLLVIVLESCVSSSTYDAMVSSRDSLALVSDSLKNLITDKSNSIFDLNGQLSDYKNQMARLQSELITAKDNYDKLKSRASESTGDLLTQIENLQAEILDKNSLIDKKQKQIDEINKKLEDRDRKMNLLKDKLTQALVGFADKGFSVAIKDGKVYVSLSNQLLFSSGSADIDTKGKDALLEIANVLVENQDLTILVEGHTDNKAVKGGYKFADNWELSTLRATEVVKFLQNKGQVNPKSLIASGRGEYLPVSEGDSADDLALNRRTEIILIPNLEEIYKVLEND